MSNDKLAIKIREFYQCLLAVGFRPDEAMKLTEGFVPKAREGTAPRKSREEIGAALETLCDAIGVYGNRLDCPVSLIFGNGLGVTEARKGGGHKYYTAGTNLVRDWIYDNQK